MSLSHLAVTAGDIYLGYHGYDCYRGREALHADVIMYSDARSTQGVLNPDNSDVTGAFRKGRRSDYCELGRTLWALFLTYVEVDSHRSY